MQQLAQYKRTEVMLTFVPNFLTRFAEKNDGHRGAGDAAFGGTEWHGVFTQPAGRKFAYLRDRYRESIKRAGFTYTLHFEMVDEGGHPLYLLYGTRHELGVEKMKDAMWSVDPAYGIQYRDPKDVQQQPLDLQFEPNTDPLLRMLLEFIAEGPAGRAIEDLQQYTLLETVYRPAQVISLIEKMREDKAVGTEPRRVTKKTQVCPYAERPGQCEFF
ncbi:three-Cys-motif partner protein TcmP [Streptomyces noursei]